MAYNLLDKISETEYEMMEKWRKWYGNKNECYFDNGNGINIKDLLSMPFGWNESKQNLYKLFGENLIISKQFEYNKSIDEMVGEFDNVLQGTTVYGRNNRSAYEFVTAFNRWSEDTFP